MLCQIVILINLDKKPKTW